MGKAFLNGLIASPINDVIVLQGRQQIVRALLHDETLNNQLSHLLQSFGNHERYLTGLWGKEQLMQFVKQGDYYATGTRIKNWPKLSNALNFVGKELNKNSWALELGSMANKFSRIHGLGFSYGATAVLSLSTLARLSYFFPPHQTIAHEVLKEQGECSPFFMKNIAIQ